MPNTCPIIITRGKNTGMACGDVNKKCRHRNNQCPYCGIRFTVDTSYTRHMNVCKKRRQQKAVERGRLPVKIKRKQPAPLPIPIPDSHDVLLEKIEKLERELEEVKQTPLVQHHHWNIVLGMNFFDELVSKMGRNRAISYLSEIAQEGKPVDVISKLYLEGNSPTQYPIACRGLDHFRYIDSDHRLIDDKGGHAISRIVTTGVQDALRVAVNEAHADECDIGVLQRYVTDMRKSLPKKHIISELALMTNIPNHPFFTVDELDIKQLDDRMILKTAEHDML